MANTLLPLYNKIGSETVAMIKQDIKNRPIWKTGRLYNSIEYKVEGSRPGDYKLIFYMVYYGVYVDEGTVHILPRKFFRKAIDIQMARYKGEIARALYESL